MKLFNEYGDRVYKATLISNLELCSMLDTEYIITEDSVIQKERKREKGKREKERQSKYRVDGI